MGQMISAWTRNPVVVNLNLEREGFVGTKVVKERIYFSNLSLSSTIFLLENLSNTSL